MRWALVHWTAMLLVLAVGCFRSETSTRTVRLATTTSVENTGLLAVVLKPFSDRSGIRVDVVAVGTGQALKLARNGDADAVLVHDEEAELEFVETGFGVNRTLLMHNDFVLLGPPGDPAGVKGLAAAQAMAKIASAREKFVSRADESGTHRRELKLWKASHAQLPQGNWYVEAGQGQRLTIQMAQEMGGYCLTDRGTYLSARDAISLVVLAEGGPELLNPYHVMAVNPETWPAVHNKEAQELIDWLSSPEAQRIIGDFKAGGIPMFHPDALD